MQNFSLVYQISEVDSGEIPRCNCISWMDGILYFIFTHCLCFPKTILFFFFFKFPSNFRSAVTCGHALHNHGGYQCCHAAKRWNTVEGWIND